jgi:hypothetical protein
MAPIEPGNRWKSSQWVKELRGRKKARRRCGEAHQGSTPAARSPGTVPGSMNRKASILVMPYGPEPSPVVTARMK